MMIGLNDSVRLADEIRLIVVTGLVRLSVAVGYDIGLVCVRDPRNGDLCPVDGFVVLTRKLVEPVCFLWPVLTV